ESRFAPDDPPALSLELRLPRRKSRFAAVEKHADFFEDFSDSGDPMAERHLRLKVRAEQISGVSRRNPVASLQDIFGIIFFADRASWKDIGAAQKIHRLGSTCEEHLDAATSARSREDH